MTYALVQSVWLLEATFANIVSMIFFISSLLILELALKYLVKELTEDGRHQ